MDEPLPLIATCAFGLEAVVARELAALGLESRVLQTGRLGFAGAVDDICRTNLHLRVAERVLIHVATIPAADFDQLFEGVKALPWEQWITADGQFPVRGRSHKSQLSSVPAVQRSVKRAIVDRLASVHGPLPESGPLYGVEVALRDDQATLTIDTTGEGLHKRGYRPLTGVAPLRETLAAALVTLSFWNPERPFLDPFCGTGTIPIEAAMIGRSMAPGLRRKFVAESWPQLPADAWRRARELAEQQVLPALPQRLIATDHDPQALKMARHHAHQAGVEEDIHWQQREFADLTSKRQYGCLICNPPYGRRLSEQREVEQLLRSFPEVLRRLPTWSHFVLCATPQFEQIIGQRADRRRKLYNGRIECQYYQFHGPLPPRRQPGESDESDESAASDESTASDATDASDAGEEHEAKAERASEAAAKASPASEPAAKPKDEAAGRVFGGLLESASRQAEEFRNRLLKRARHLRRWPQRGITCFRLYERDIPEVPLVVDRYEGCLHIAEFDRPHERTPAQHADWLELMAKTAGEALDVPPERVYLKRRSRQRSSAQYEKQDARAEALVVEEGGLKFHVNLSDYIDTGLFLDHRITRAMVRDACQDARFLNLFGYCGSFTVYAAAGGARSTTTVDLSWTYLDWAQRNLDLNGLGGPQHRFVRSDVLSFVEQLSDEQFDVAVVDPPTFSNSKTTDEDWELQRDYARLLNALTPHMAPGGVLFFSTNFRRFKFDAAELPGLTAHEISKQTVPEDFRNRRIHRCWRLTPE